MEVQRTQNRQHNLEKKNDYIISRLTLSDRNLLYRINMMIHKNNRGEVLIDKYTDSQLTLDTSAKVIQQGKGCFFNKRC